MAGEQHFECIRRHLLGVKELPVSLLEPVGNRNWIKIHEGLGCNGQLPMDFGNIEVMNCVRQRVAVKIDSRTWLHGQFEGVTPLRALAARLHPRLHDALVHAGAISEVGYVTDGVVHRCLMRPRTPQWGGQYRLLECRRGSVHTAAARYPATGEDPPTLFLRCC